MTSDYERNANSLTVVLLVILASASLIGTLTLPNQIPIHYNWRGQPDRWGHASTLLLIPLIASLLSGLLWFINRTPTHLLNFPGPRTPQNIERQVANIRLMTASMRVFVALLFLALQSQSIWAAAQQRPRLSIVTLPVIVLVQMGVLGFFIWRAYKLVPRP